jgi:hypothetical protein
LKGCGDTFGNAQRKVELPWGSLPPVSPAVFIGCFHWLCKVEKSVRKGASQKKAGFLKLKQKLKMQ